MQNVGHFVLVEMFQLSGCLSYYGSLLIITVISLWYAMDSFTSAERRRLYHNLCWFLGFPVSIREYNVNTVWCVTTFSGETSIIIPMQSNDCVRIGVATLQKRIVWIYKGNTQTVQIEFTGNFNHTLATLNLFHQD